MADDVWIARDLYPECDRGDWFSSPHDYKPLVELFGNVVIRVDENNYQGDSWVLYHIPGADGPVEYLEFGWGSCSGCDALQACESYEDIARLIGKLRNDIRKFDTIAEAREWFMNLDVPLRYAGTFEEYKRFVSAVCGYLMEIPDCE